MRYPPICDEGSIHSISDQKRAKRLRDFVTLTLVQIPNVFRPGTGMRLNYRSNNTGHLRRRHNNCGEIEWYINAPKEYFKNHESYAVMNGYERIASNVNGLYDVIEEYLNWARPILVWPAKTDALIVRSPKYPRHDNDSYSTYIIRLTGGISCTQIRKIFSTDRYKTTKDLGASGDVLANDSPEIYTRIPARERSRGAEDHVEMTKPIWPPK